MAKNLRLAVCARHRFLFTAVVSLFLLAVLFITPTVLQRSWMQARISRLKVGMHTTDLVRILGERYHKAYTVPQPWMPEALRNAENTIIEYDYLRPVWVTLFIHEIWSVYLDDEGTIIFIKPSPSYVLLFDGGSVGFLLFLGGVLVAGYGLVAATISLLLKHFCRREDQNDLKADGN